VNLGTGVGLIAAGTILGSLTALVLWRRLRAIVTVPLLAAAGVAVGAGALLLQEHVTPVDWAFTLAALGVYVPVHVRVLLGPAGRQEPARVVAEGP
jgi:hypothetical protein